MTDTARTANRRPLNIVTAKGSSAERFFLDQAGLPGAEAPEPEAIASGLRPRRRHDLIFHGGKTIPDLTFTNLFVGGSSSWRKSDICADACDACAEARDACAEARDDRGVEAAYGDAETRDRADAGDMSVQECGRNESACRGLPALRGRDSARAESFAS